MTADGEQTGQDAERTNTRAKSLEEFIKGLVQDAEGMRKAHFLFLFFRYRKIKGFYGASIPLVKTCPF